MTDRPYYSARRSLNQRNLDFTKKMFLVAYEDFQSRSYFDEHFGYECVDGPVSGLLGKKQEYYVTRAINKFDLFPIDQHIDHYTVYDLFDMIEFLYDHVSKPMEGWYHDFGDCGTHYHTFEQEQGQAEFRGAINNILSEFEDGYELTPQGEIVMIPPTGLNTLLEADLPVTTSEDIKERLSKAIKKFRSSRSTWDLRHDAARDLGDILESLRPQLKEVMTDDENDLFNILNNFGIRHNNDRQQANYDKPIFLTWLFYYYLAAIHAALRLTERYGETPP